MVYANLSKYQKMRFDSTGVCKICGQNISKNEDFELVVTRSSRFKVYSFFHHECLDFTRKRMADVELTSREGV